MQSALLSIEHEIFDFNIGRIEYVAWDCTVDSDIFVRLECIHLITKRVSKMDIHSWSIDGDSSVTPLRVRTKKGFQSYKPIKWVKVNIISQWEAEAWSIKMKTGLKRSAELVLL